MYLVPKKYAWSEFPEDNITGFEVESVHADGSSFSPAKKVTTSGLPKENGAFNLAVSDELRTPTGEPCKFAVTALGTPGNGNSARTLSDTFTTTEVPEPPAPPFSLTVWN